MNTVNSDPPFPHLQESQEADRIAPCLPGLGRLPKCRYQRIIVAKHPTGIHDSGQVRGVTPDAGTAIQISYCPECNF